MLLTVSIISMASETTRPVRRKVGPQLNVACHNELFQRHLNGEINLGIIPIRSNSIGGIDVDKYDLIINL